MTNGSGSGSGTGHGAPQPTAQAAGPSLFPARRSSYASIVSGATPRSGALSHLINVTTGNPNQHHPDYRHSRQQTGQETETNPNGAVPFGSSRRKVMQLPSYSRQFANMPGQTSNGYGSQNTFFIPSYLRDSKHVAKLEAAHKAKAAAHREHTSPHSSNPASLSTSSSNVNLHRMAPSHRGMTYEIEHAPQSEDESLMPLPSKWSDEEKNAGLDVLGEGLEIRYNGPSSKADMDAAAARADYPMSPQCGIYYFEVEVKNKSRDGMIAVGFSSRKASLDRLPGWETESWAYHGDDGKIFCGESTGKNYGPTFTVNDIVGCGINFWTGCAFFTKNGVDLGIAFRELKNVRPFPSVGMKKHSGAWTSVNFGQRPFVFNIDGMMAQEQKTVENEIMATKPTSLRPPFDEDTLVQELVAHFLAHDGYVETVKAFASERRAASIALRGAQEAPSEEVEVEDDLDAVNRQRIRASILEGDIDKALKHTNAYYPQVLERNPQIVFRLKCRKFVELIRKCSDIQTLPAHRAAKSSNGHSPTSDTEVLEQDMELDDQMNEGYQWDEMDTEDAENSMRYEQLLQEAMVYGQVLGQEYRDESREYKRTLEQVHSLIAYPDAKSSVHGHLLDPKGRVTVAEELNSAILVSLGRSSSAALERLYQQTEALIDEISQDGGPGAFVNLQGNFLA